MQDDKLVLAPYTKIGVQDGVLFLGFGSIQMIVKSMSLIGPIIRLLHAWITPASLQHMRNRFADEIQSLEGFEGIFQRIVDSPCVISVSQIGDGRYSRHMRQYALAGADPRSVQDRLLKSHVTILGCGGIGNIVSLNLATAGVGALHLVDADMVELSNLTRQHLFREGDIGRRKIDVLEETLSVRNSEIRITTDDLRIDVEEDFKKLPSTDLVVLSADAYGLLHKTNAYCVASGTPFLNVSYIEDIAVWGPLVVPRQTGCWGCTSVVADHATDDASIDQKMREVNKRYQPPSFGPINTLASALAALDIIKFLGDYGSIATKNKRVGLWTHELRLEEQKFTRNLNCKICGEKS